MNLKYLLAQHSRSSWQNVDNERRARHGATTHFRAVPIADRGTRSPN